MSLKPVLFSISIPSRWADEDRYGHINNVAYFRYFEEARVQWLRSLNNIDSRINCDVDGLDTGPVVVEVAATYLKPVHYPATVIVNATVRKLGNSSVILDHELVTAEQPEVIFTRGHAAIVWVDHRSQQAIPLPAALKDYLQTFIHP
jgi:acyl-CoA thioester hydrolase